MTRKRGPKPKSSTDLQPAEIIALPHISTTMGAIERMEIQRHTIAPATKVDKLRLEENTKLDKMEAPLWKLLNAAERDPKKAGSVSQVVYALLKVQERRAKLNGLDLNTGAHMSYSQIEIIYRDKDTGQVIEAPAWSVDDADSD